MTTDEKISLEEAFKRLRLGFLVIGAENSGLFYTAKLFRGIGINCGYESMFRTNHINPNNNNYVGDASSWAVPYAQYFNGAIFYQMRDPLEVLFTIKTHIDGYRRMGRNINPDDMLGAMDIYLKWHNLCEQSKPSLTFRIEKFNLLTFELFCYALGLARSQDELCDVLDRTDKSLCCDKKYEWDELPKSPQKEKLQQIAKKYKYLV
jgi:hypothetical protein